MLMVTLTPSELIAFTTLPLVKKLSFEIVMKCVRAVSRSKAAMLTKSIVGTDIAVGTGRIFNIRRASEMRP
jgi:hypothetical protein